VGYIEGFTGADQRSMRHTTSAPQEVLRLQGLNPFGTFGDVDVDVDVGVGVEKGGEASRSRIYSDGDSQDEQEQ
jgi:hypothetical protein